MTKAHFNTKSAWWLGMILMAFLVIAAGCKKNTTSTPDKPQKKAVQNNTKQADPAETAAAQAKETIKVPPAPDDRTISEGHLFPDLEFTSISGDKIKISDLKGKVVLIDFWATWCPPCRAAIPDIVKIYNELHGKGFEIVGISLDQNKASLEKYTKDNGMTWQQYFDGLGWNNKLAKRFGVRSIPHIVLLDKQGAVYFQTDYQNGKPPLHGADLKKAIEALLK